MPMTSTFSSTPPTKTPSLPPTPNANHYPLTSSSARLSLITNSYINPYAPPCSHPQRHHPSQSQQVSPPVPVHYQQLNLLLPVAKATFYSLKKTFRRCMLNGSPVHGNILHGQCGEIDTFLSYQYSMVNSAVVLRKIHSMMVIATRLQRLHLISVGGDEDFLAETLGKFPLLEELELSYCFYFDTVVERVGPACPQLKSFRLNERVFTFQPPTVRFRQDAAALAIAKHFKQLRRLRLRSNYLTGVGLSAIIDNCPYLEYLDIRRCFHACDLDESLKSKCAGIKELRRANDPTSDSEFPDKYVLKLAAG
ncbi:putative F-box/LRR-repeat protein 21 [Platanthera guangdongensis]|uniref:F-box/LRR-repeat protein 21 n=1 Tax=Platanthera guangdongensis TaxID=2320717 RepID=A0ABR2MRK8_9ASPA